VGGIEDFLPGKLEPSVRDHSGEARILMVILLSGHLTFSGGQFVWGEHLNGGTDTLKCLSEIWFFAGTTVQQV
jgi:hypothetical protein